jgi:hypothetical protein
MSDYIRYYHEVRTHLGLGKQTPAGRKVAKCPGASRNFLSLPRLGGLYHHYDLAA